MPEENQKTWTKLVKKQSRTTWAVLGVALVALLLAVWWVPILASVPEISFSSGDDEDGEDGNEAGVNHDGGWIRILRRLDSEEVHGYFAIEIECTKSYQVKAIYVDWDDPDYDLEVDYFKVFIQREFTGAGVETWDIDHDDYSPSDASRGEELLALMDVEAPVGVPQGFTFTVGGAVTDTLDGGDDRLTVIAVLETAGNCRVTIDP